MQGTLSTPNTIQKEELIFTEADPSMGGAILGVLEGECADCIDATRNGRYYDEELWEHVFNSELVQELLDNGGVPGELDHPVDRDETDSSRIAILMKEKPHKRDGKLWARFSIVNTPLGQIAYALAKAGFKFGVSSRGSGDTYIDSRGRERVDPNSYDFKGFDLVLLPAIKAARMKLITEGLNTSKFNYKQALRESLNSASESDRKIMNEELTTLGIVIDEDDVEIINVDVEKELKEHYGELDTPYFGCSCILDNGKFLNLRNCIYTCEVEKYLNDKHMSNHSTEGITYSPSLRDRDYIEISTDNPRIDLPENITKDQYKALAAWLEMVSKVTNKIIVHTNKDNQYANYDVFDMTVQDIIDNIEEYYTKGVLPTTDTVDSLDTEDLEEDFAATINGAELIEELQESLVKNEELQSQMTKLQEKLSACYTREKAQEDKIKAYKAKISQMNESLKSIPALKTRVDSLTEKLKSMDSKVNTDRSTVMTLNEAISGNETKINELTESLNMKDQKINRLTHLVESLNEELTRKNESIEKAKTSHNEAIAEMNKDSQLKQQRYSKKLQDAKSLVEKYERVAHTAIDKYIECKADMYDISVNEIKSRLREHFNFEDIDAVCDDLQDYRLNMSAMPFNGRPLKSSKVLITESRKTSRVSDDTDVDEDLLRLAGLI